jgi:hypothetical protein
MLSMTNPRYPVQVELQSSHPLALVSAVRQALRRFGVEAGEIQQFCRQAFAHRDDPEALRQLCSRWATVKAPLPEE